MSAAYRPVTWIRWWIPRTPKRRNGKGGASDGSSPSARRRSRASTSARAESSAPTWRTPPRVPNHPRRAMRRAPGGNPRRRRRRRVATRGATPVALATGWACSAASPRPGAFASFRDPRGGLARPGSHRASVSRDGRWREGSLGVRARGSSVRVIADASISHDGEWGIFL